MIDPLHNIWFITIAGGALATIIASFFIVKKSDKNVSQTQTQTQTQQTIVTTNINTHDQKKEIAKDIIDTTKVAFYKDTARILFIDDLDLKNKINNLVSAGWKNVFQINEANNIDQSEIRQADIIFVDYKGIGMLSAEQGLGVLSALKERYQNNKWLILYSAHEVPINAFNKGANSYLAKNSSVYELEQKIIEGFSKIQK